jgi:RNA polymerase sigma-70 factor (ECF subfamily)
MLADLEAARLVIRFQAGDAGAFAGLYRAYFDRVYGYLRVMLKDRHSAEDVTQQVFQEIYQAIPGYERRDRPFRAWLFAIVRNQAVSYLRRTGKIDPVAPEEMARRAESMDEMAGTEAIEWLADQDLVLFVERLPLPQRQVLLLRFMLDLRHAEVAQILGRSETDVRALQHRALRFLEQRLRAIGRVPRERGRATMRRSLRPAHVLRSRRFALR